MVQGEQKLINLHKFVHLLNIRSDIWDDPVVCGHKFLIKRTDSHSCKQFQEMECNFEISLDAHGVSLHVSQITALNKHGQILKTRGVLLRRMVQIINHDLNLIQVHNIKGHSQNLHCYKTQSKTCIIPMVLLQLFFLKPYTWLINPNKKNLRSE